MLTRVWTERVAPDWTIHVGNADTATASAADWTTAEDGALVAATLAGHRDAFDVIVERHRRQVYQLCYRYVGNHEDASDLAQDVFIRAYKGLRGFKGESTLQTWLYRIGINVCLNRLALKTPRAEALDTRDRADLQAERADAALLRAERASEVRAAIRRLPRKQRATLILRVYHELPHEEIAGILGSSVGAAKANFFHALANLKKMLR
jgi:RNA polymerase sigma-70 factor (ECF subfamily)